MHPPLDAHLHSLNCRAVIEELLKCHKDNPLRKYLGVCNQLKRDLNKCLQEEYLERRQRNWEESQRLKEAARNIK